MYAEASDAEIEESGSECESDSYDELLSEGEEEGGEGVKEVMVDGVAVDMLA